MIKFILTLIIVYIVFKIIKWFFKPVTRRASSEPKVRNSQKNTASIPKEDIIEAKFEEIKTQEKDKA